MKCGMCGYEFNMEEAETSCGGCPLVKGCGLVRCPRCGYEMPPEAALVRWVKRIFTTKAQRAQRLKGQDRQDGKKLGFRN
jgi:rubredoxin